MALSNSPLGGEPRLAFVLAVFALSGVAVPLSEPGECTHFLERLERQFDQYVATSNENWESLFPSLNDAKACYGETHSEETARLANYETSLLYRDGRYEEATAAFARFFDHDVDFASPDILVKMYQRRAVMYSRTGRPLEALHDFLASTPHIHHLPPGDGSESYVRIGNQFRAFGDYEGALPYYAQADSLILANLDENPALIAYRGRILLSKASLLADAARRDLISVKAAAREATPLLEEALTVIPADDPNFLYEYVQTLLRLSELYRWAGEPARSFPLIEQARLISLPSIQRNSTRVSWSYTELGHTHLQLGNFNEARDAFETSLAMDREGLRPRLVMESLNDLGLLAEAVADTSAQPDYELAMTYYEQAVEIAELDRRAFGHLEWSASVFERVQEPYRNLIRLLLGEGRFEEAFLKLDETRARYMQDLRFTNRLRPILDVGRRRQIDSLEAVQDNARFETLNPQISLARRNELMSEILATSEEANRLMGFEPTPPMPLSLETIQRVLEAQDQTLLTYFLDGSASYALVVSPDTLVGLTLPIQVDSLSGLVSSLGEAWLNTGTPEPYVDTSVLNTLYSALIQPVEHLLQPDRALVIIPEGYLTTLPFAALAPESDETDYASLDYLGRHHPLSMELSASLFAEQSSPNQASSKNDLLAFGRSIFQEQSPLVPTRASAPLADLPNVPEELNRLRALFPSGQFAMNQEATETALYGSMSDARVVHLASHAIMNPSLPLFSYISLWDGDENDGTLFLYELQSKQLTSDLVVLSGCSTARGQRHLGEGMIGLQHAFRAAGAGSILATMWQVEDRAMTDLISRFYTHLRNGERKDRALQLAQMEYLEDNTGIRASPFFWASTTFYGGPSPLNWQHTYVSARMWLVLGMALLLAGIGLPHMLRRRTMSV